MTFRPIGSSVLAVTAFLCIVGRAEIPLSIGVQCEGIDRYNSTDKSIKSREQIPWVNPSQMYAYYATVPLPIFVGEEPPRRAVVQAYAEGRGSSAWARSWAEAEASDHFQEAIADSFAHFLRRVADAHPRYHAQFCLENYSLVPSKTVSDNQKLYLAVFSSRKVSFALCDRFDCSP